MALSNSQGELAEPELESSCRDFVDILDILK